MSLEKHDRGSHQVAEPQLPSANRHLTPKSQSRFHGCTDAGWLVGKGW